MKQVLYSKYNRTRESRFQIGTRIFVENGKKYVEKYALEKTAYEHIENMEKWGNVLPKVYVNIHFPEVIKNENGRILFGYVEGDKLSDTLSEKLDNKELFVEELTRYLNLMVAFQPEYTCKFTQTEKFNEVFGNAEELEGLEAVSYCNIDMILDNVFVAQESISLIDNEWGMDFPIPVNFLKYRTLYYYYVAHQYELQNWYSLEAFLNCFGIEKRYSDIFACMELNFQQYVHGIKYLEQYIQNNASLEALLNTIQRLEKDVEDKNRKVEDLNIQYENTKIELDLARVDNREKQKYINLLEGLKEEYRIELDKIRYYKKHPVRRAYRIARRIGGKVSRKVNPVLRKILPDSMYYKKLAVPTFETPKVSIVIPVYNEFDYTYKCIKSIIENVKTVPYEIIIGDDESKDTTKKIKKIIKNIKVNINHSDHGFLMNCNRAAKLAEGEYIVFLNNDTLVKEEWLKSLVTLIESDETIGLVGSKLVYPDGSLQEAGGIIWKDATGWNYGRGQNPDMPEYNYVRECDYISGASIMISKALWEEIGGFDERFKPAYCEDSDLAFEVRKRGYKVCYQPKSVVVHFEGVSNGTDLSAGLKKYQVENNIKFKEKWKNELEGHYESGQKPFCARERNYGKKVVLFIDHYVPTYDKDAGSKTTFQYIKMFLSKGYVVKFIGDNYAQMEPYTTTLQQMGVEVLYGPWYMEHIFEWIEDNKESISFVYLNRPHISIKYIDFFKNRTDIKVIYYGHDLHFLRTQREAELTGNKELMKEAEHWKSTELGLMRKAAISYYPSVIEENAIHEIDESIPVKAITAYVFDKFIENYQYDGEQRNGILFVGGFSHGPNVDAVKWFVEEIYSKVREKKDIPFIIVGSNAPEEIKALHGNGIIFKGFVSDEELTELYRTSRMVVVPLRYGAGVKGKVVEAIYNGAPIVTTGVGAEGIVGVENVLSVKDDPTEFAEEILTLYDDMEKLATMGNATQKFIKENFSIEAVWKNIEEDFK